MRTISQGRGDDVDPRANAGLEGKMSDQDLKPDAAADLVAQVDTGARAPAGWQGRMILTIAFILFLIPKTRKNFITLNIGAVLIYTSVYIEKGIALIIPGFTPDVLGQLYVYTPSWTEIRTSALIFSLGALMFTFLVKIAIAIVFEDYNIDSIKRNKKIVPS